MSAFGAFEKKAAHAETVLAVNVVYAAVLMLHQLVYGVLPPDLQATLLIPSTMLNIARIPMLILGAVFFIPWFTRAYDWGIYLTQSVALQAKKQQGLLAWSFFIPVLSLYWPYAAVSALDQAAEPEVLPAPEEHSAADAPSGYRTPQRTQSAPPSRLGHAPVGMWWAAWVVSNSLGAFQTLPQSWELRTLLTEVTLAVRIAAAVGAILVVRRITARLRELARRSHALG
jgi:hypothetical protein